MTIEKATFGAGCFWGVEEAFRTLEGVVSTTVGYMGGDTEEPSYEDVCTDTTGHAEVVQVEFDTNVISYAGLLRFFWQMHDPTTPNRQGADVGTQYRSVIFTHSPEQDELAHEALKKAQEQFEAPIVTEIVPSWIFWPAEEYHQKYLLKRGKGSCSI